MSIITLGLDNINSSMIGELNGYTVDNSSDVEVHYQFFGTNKKRKNEHSLTASNKIIIKIKPKNEEEYKIFEFSKKEDISLPTLMYVNESKVVDITSKVNIYIKNAINVNKKIKFKIGEINDKN